MYWGGVRLVFSGRAFQLGTGEQFQGVSGLGGLEFLEGGWDRGLGGGWWWGKVEEWEGGRVDGWNG